MRTVWFIRHVQSQSNAGLRTESDQAGGITEKGERQAKLLATAFDRQPDLIVTSPYIRTQLTAQPTIERFPNVPCEEWAVQEFSHLAPAVRNNTAMSNRRVHIVEYWDRCDPFHVHGEGAECFADLMDRIYAMNDRLAKTHGQFIAIFSHSQYIRTLLWMNLSNFFVTKPALTTDLMKEFRSFDLGLAIPNAAIVPALQDDAGKLYFGAVNTAHLNADLIT
jgi:broad specificity phosphatase PhoE